MRTWLLLFFVFIIIPVHQSVAQILPTLPGAEIAITLNPQYPSPGESVTATLDDYSLGGGGATISWFIDGLSVPNVNNVRSITFVAPFIGESMKLVARRTDNTGAVVEARRTITPWYLDIIIEPQTYTPAFYQGRALPSQGSIVNINALLQNKAGVVDQNKYSYSWTLNGKSVYGGARTGGNWAQIVVPKGSASTLTISVADTTGAVVARKVVALPSVPISLQFYELNTLLGLSKKAIGRELILVGNSSSIKAVPYFLDLRAVDGNLATEWSINNQTVQTENDDPFEINLTRGVAGSARVGFKVTNLASFIQNDEAGFQIKF